MARLTINQSDEQVTFEANTPNRLSEVYRIKVPDKQVYTLRDGALLVMKLRKADGTEIDSTSDIVFSAIRPGRRLPVEIDGKDYIFWTIPQNDQWDTNKNQDIRLQIQGGYLDLLETHEFIIAVNSPDLIDEDQSNFTLEFDYVPYRDRA